MNKSSIARKLAVVTLVCAAALSSQAPQAGLLDGRLFELSDIRIDNWLQQPNGTLKWNDWDSMWLERVPRDQLKQPNQHPVQISADNIAEALSHMVLNSGRRGPQPLFTASELKDIAPAFSAMLSVARPDQSVAFSSSAMRKIGSFENWLTNAGHLFYTDGKLNVQLGSALLNLSAQFQASGKGEGVKIDYGTLGVQSPNIELSVSGAGDVVKRPDWAAVVVAGATPGNVLPGGRAVGGGVVAAPAAAAAATPETQAAKTETRFKTLQRLHNQGLISDAEFEKKRVELLKEL